MLATASDSSQVDAGQKATANLRSPIPRIAATERTVKSYPCGVCTTNVGIKYE
jgi:hypothetical protein